MDSAKNAKELRRVSFDGITQELLFEEQEIVERE